MNLFHNHLYSSLKCILLKKSDEKKGTNRVRPSGEKAHCLVYTICTSNINIVWLFLLFDCFCFCVCVPSSMPTEYLHMCVGLIRTSVCHSATITSYMNHVISCVKRIAGKAKKEHFISVINDACFRSSSSESLTTK